MSTRVLGVLAAAVMLLVGGAGPAMAVEDGAEIQRPTLEELGCDAPVEERPLVCPADDAAAPPGWFVVASIPLAVLGLIAVVAVLMRYLQWQPRFAREREQKVKSRR